MDEMIGVALRVSIAYIYVLAMLRLSGRRSVGHLSPFDLLIALVIGDMFDDIFWGEIPLSLWLVGVSTIILLHMLTEYGAFRSKLVARVVVSERTILIRMGEPDRKGMARERVSDEELSSELRMQGLEGPSRVGEAALEPSGQLSSLEKEEYQPALKRDLPRLRRAA
jgi:uncharacterized membrane protein YcaP (DUF421 family)